MRDHITTQLKLASALGITAEYFSLVKKTHCASDTLLIELEKLTGISQVYWASPKRKALLDRDLKQFFKREKLNAASQAKKKDN